MRGACLLLAGLLPALGGCGGTFELPTESRANRVIPTDQSYQMINTWTGMEGVQDLLLTQGTGSQLFILFNRGGTGPGARGEVRAYPLSQPVPLAGIEFPGLFNPVALAAGGGRLFVLDQGDTCLARTNPATGTCDSTRLWTSRITDLSKYWRVHEFGLLGGPAHGTFTDTTVAFVRGIAADAQGNVYVAGSAIIRVPQDIGAHVIFTRTFQYRIYRYRPGPRPQGGPDPRMPGSNWHRDGTWEVEEGSGRGTVSDPRGIFWSSSPTDAPSPALYVADFGKNWVQKVSDQRPADDQGFYFLDGGLSGTPFNGPTRVAVDRRGFMYIADTGNQRVVRYGPGPTYIQRVDVEPDAQNQPLVNPVSVAADDSLVYVAERDLGKVIRYKRRK